MRVATGSRVALLLLLAGLTAGCGADDGAEPTTDPTATDDAAAAEAPAAATDAEPDGDAGSADGTPDDGAGETDADAFCATAAPALQVVDREIIGSAEHVEMLESVAVSARDDLGDGDLADDVADLADHYATSVSPADPASQDFDSFPAGVQDTALDVQEQISALC
ncbi:hypothetical protein [Isoptericola sp. AK164]|uniref:hypothetical protein n=1 Tax=Isoptericola sp. AK164 TaxID=3024246 RepID=UPI0024187B85|nr:hypothetical protein [Isoptericola sp. AK164]